MRNKRKEERVKYIITARIEIAKKKDTPKFSTWSVMDDKVFDSSTMGPCAGGEYRREEEKEKEKEKAYVRGVKRR